MTIILENISVKENGQYIIKDFNLEIEWDKCYAFTGPSGSGKSDLLEIFMGTQKPAEGQVVRMGDYKYPTLKSAYVPQEGSLNIKKDAIWNVKKAHRWANKKSAMAELSQFMTEEKMTTSVSELTGVERRYIEIVKALFIPADFLVFDEPFLGMNEEQKQQAINYIMDKRGSRPLLIAGRDVSGIKFDKVIDLSLRR